MDLMSEHVSYYVVRVSDTHAYSACVLVLLDAKIPLHVECVKAVMSGSFRLVILSITKRLTCSDVYDGLLTIERESLLKVKDSFRYWNQQTILSNTSKVFNLHAWCHIRNEGLIMLVIKT